MALLPSFLLAFGDFEVRMCRTFVWPRLIFPDAVFLKRLAAPEWVFNLGIFFLVFLDRLGYPSKASAGQGFPYAHKALTIIPGKSDLIHSWSVRLYGFVSLIPNALFKNSMIRCRASYPCHGSGTGRPNIAPASGPWLSRGYVTSSTGTPSCRSARYISSDCPNGSVVSDCPCSSMNGVFARAAPANGLCFHASSMCSHGLPKYHRSYHDPPSVPYSLNWSITGAPEMMALNRSVLPSTKPAISPP